MLTLLDTLIGFMAPHQCLGCGIEGSLLCPACIVLIPDALPACYRCRTHSYGGRTCATCRKTSPLQSVQTITPYEGVARELVRQLKFERAFAGAEPIARAIAQTATFPASAVIVPVPTAPSRVRQRGYDQSLVIARRVAVMWGLSCSQDLLRIGSQRQTGSSRKERLRQLDDAFIVRNGKLSLDVPIVLLDDVMTTGATLEAAAFALRAAGARSVHGITFARA